MRLLVAAVAVLISAPASAARVRLDIAPGPLGGALVAVGEQARVTIGFTDSVLARIPVRGLHARVDVATALARLLRGTEADFRQVDEDTFVVVRRVPAPRRRPPPSAPAPPAPAPALAPASDIIVTASKRGASLDRYPGGAVVTDARRFLPTDLAHGSEALVEQQPILSATHLGPGRNKLFIRGIADSSFNGPSQATVGEYLGEARLNYNAPDPDLALYDIASIEVLEGPQGTLYGAGSIGGIVRLVPTPPDLAHFSGELSVGGSSTAHGAPGGDGALIVNLPLVQDRLALRAVGYGSLDGGYIDDPSRGLTDINRTVTRGGRATLRFAPSPDWTIEAGGVIQNINSKDGQYDERGLPRLQRASVLAQPFDNDYALASLVVRHEGATLALTSNTSIALHDVGTTFDASPSPATPIRYDEDNRILLLSNETRLSRRTADGGGWVAGIQLLRSSDRLTRVLGPPGAQLAITGTRNLTEEASLFGEATFVLSPRLSVTGGGRLGYLRSAGRVLDDPDEGEAPHSHSLSVLPSLGLLWEPRDHLALYARYQRGYRPGGLSVQEGIVQRFQSDRIYTVEAGVRYGTPRDRLSATAAFSYARWDHIQADLVGLDGLPYTANIGEGRIYGGEFRGAFRPDERFVLQADMFVNNSRLARPDPAFAGESDASLPDIAGVIGRIVARYTIRVAGRPIALNASLGYVGRSRLGVGTALDLHQGAYVQTGAGLGTTIGRFTFSLDATNLLDRRGNIFALGDPFGVASGRQRTPLRPRTVRLGASTAF